MAYLRAKQITHVVDATHPFAAQMSANAIEACESANVPLIALTRTAWQPRPGDHWKHVADMAGAITALECPPERIMLAVGRMHLEEFAGRPEHFYLLRLVDSPTTPLPLPRCKVVVDRGPFTESGDLALMRENRIGLVVSKNSGGGGAYAKLAAARILGLPVIMIDRPAVPTRQETQNVDYVLRWLDHGATDLGV